VATVTVLISGKLNWRGGVWSLQKGKFRKMVAEIYIICILQWKMCICVTLKFRSTSTSPPPLHPPWKLPKTVCCLCHWCCINVFPWYIERRRSFDKNMFRVKGHLYSKNRTVEPTVRSTYYNYGTWRRTSLHWWINNLLVLSSTKFPYCNTNLIYLIWVGVTSSPCSPPTNQHWT